MARKDKNEVGMKKSLTIIAVAALMVTSVMLLSLSLGISALGNVGMGTRYYEGQPIVGSVSGPNTPPNYNRGVVVVTANSIHQGSGDDTDWVTGVEFQIFYGGAWQEKKPIAKTPGVTMTSASWTVDTNSYFPESVDIAVQFRCRASDRGSEYGAAYDDAKGPWTYSDTYYFDNDSPTITVNTASYPPATSAYAWYSSDPGKCIDVDFSNDAGDNSKLDQAIYKFPGESWNPSNPKRVIFDADTPTYTTNWALDWATCPKGINTITMKLTDKAANTKEATFTFIKGNTNIVPKSRAETLWGKWAANPDATNVTSTTLLSVENVGANPNQKYVVDMSDDCFKSAAVNERIEIDKNADGSVDSKGNIKFFYILTTSAVAPADFTTYTWVDPVTVGGDGAYTFLFTDLGQYMYIGYSVVDIAYDDVIRDSNDYRASVTLSAPKV